METPLPAEDATATAAAVTPPPPPPPSTLDASLVADYLLSRRHLAAAFELYQDYLADGSVTRAAGAGAGAGAVSAVSPAASNGTEDGTAKRENNDGEVEARDALEAYFAHPQRFPLADLQRYANAVDSECSAGAHSPPLLPGRRKEVLHFYLFFLFAFFLLLLLRPPFSSKTHRGGVLPKEPFRATLETHHRTDTVVQ